MTTDVKVLIAEFLRTHKRLVVPQLGAFIVKAPGGEILFSELFKRDDGVLRGLLTAAGRQRDRSGGRHRPADFRSAPRRAARRRVSRRGAGDFLRRRQRDAGVRLRSAGRCRGGACIGGAGGFRRGDGSIRRTRCGQDRCIRHGRIGRVGCRRPRTDAAL